MAKESVDVLSHGDEAPTFELPGADGETYALSDVADGRGLLVVFTCNHCPYAEAKRPLLNDLAAEYDDVAVVGVNSNANEDYPDDAFEVMADRVADGTVAFDAYLFDESQAVAADYGAVCTPDPFLFRVEDGTPRLVYHGRLDDAPNPNDEPTRIVIREAIDAVLAGRDVDVDEEPARGCSIKWRAGNEPEYWEDL